MAKEKPKKKKFEFAQIVTILTIIIFSAYGVWSGIEYYRLCRLAIENCSTMPDATLAVTCVTTILGAFMSYCLYQFGLKNSRNKFGIDKDGQPYTLSVEPSEDNNTDFPVQDTFEDGVG